MDIKEHVALLKDDPKAYHIIGKGGRCLALVNRHYPQEVLLLESAKESSEDTVVKPDNAHARSVGFARMYDKYIAAGIEAQQNAVGDNFAHSFTFGSISPDKFNGPFPLHIGLGKNFLAYSARMIKLIPGQALHYMDFIDPNSPLTKANKEALAKDIAKWLYTLHHSVSAEAFTGNKIAQQFADAGTNVTQRFNRSEKFKLFVDINLREIRTLKQKLADGTMNEDFRKKFTDNLAATGVNFDLLASLAEKLAAKLQQVLPQDRFGLTHSDVHPANIIARPDYNGINGVCDWMTGTMDTQSVDFAGLGYAKGLLPKVVRHYHQLEKDNHDDRQVNREAIYAYSAMRQIFVTVKALKRADLTETHAARVAWGQVTESVTELARLSFGDLARRLKRQRLPPIVMPSRSTMSAQPSPVRSPVNAFS